MLKSEPPSARSTAGMTANDFELLHAIVRRARQNLDQNAWDYIVGGTETETTLRRNRMALDSIAFKHRVLRDVSRVSASVERLGRKLRLPIVLAPIGSLESFQPGGAVPAARAAAQFGVPHMLSSACDPDLEQLAAEAPDARSEEHTSELQSRFGISYA